MARKRKSKVVDYVEHTPSGLSVEIKLNTETLSFEAELPDGSFMHNEQAKELKNIVYRLLKEMAVLDWHDVIRVERLAPFATTSNDFIGFKITRYHWAKKADAGFVHCPWLKRPTDPYSSRGKNTLCEFMFVDYMHVNQRIGFEPPFSDGDNYYLPYSSALWAGLNRLIVAIRELRDHLLNLMDTEQGRQHLVDVGDQMLKLLPIGEEK